MVVLTIVVSCAVFPNYLVVLESPMYLYKQGKVVSTIKTLHQIAIRNKKNLEYKHFEKQLGINYIDLDYYPEIEVIRKSYSMIMLEDQKREDFEEQQGLNEADSEMMVMEVVKKNNDTSKQYLQARSQGMFSLLSDSKLSIKMLALCFQSATVFTIYYGLTSSMQDLGLPNIQMNGILTGLTQMVGFLAISIYGPTIPRITASRVLLSLEILAALILLSLSYFEQNSFCLLIQSIVSTVLMTTAVSAHIAILYIQNAENFPTEHRGFACAIILLFGKMSGASAPMIEEYTKSIGVHVLVGCSGMALVALPMTVLLTETLGNKKMS